MRDILDRINDINLFETKSSDLMDRIKIGDKESLEFAETLGIPPAVLDKFGELGDSYKEIHNDPKAIKIYQDVERSIESYLDKVLNAPISRRSLFRGTMNFIALVNNMDTIFQILKQPTQLPVPSSPLEHMPEPKIKGMDITEIYQMITSGSADNEFKDDDTALFWIETTEKFIRAGIRPSRLKELINYFSNPEFEIFTIWDIEEFIEDPHFRQNALDSGELDEEHWAFIQELWEFLNNWTPDKKFPDAGVTIPSKKKLYPGDYGWRRDLE